MIRSLSDSRADRPGFFGYLVVALSSRRSSMTLTASYRSVCTVVLLLALVKPRAGDGPRLPGRADPAGIASWT